MPQPEDLVGQVIKMRGNTGSIDQVQGGRASSRREIETIRQLRRELGPDIPLRIDPNSAWTVETSVRVGRELPGKEGRIP